MVELMPQYRSLEFGVHAIYPTRQYVAPKVRALVDFLFNALKDACWCSELSA